MNPSDRHFVRRLGRAVVSIGFLTGAGILYAGPLPLFDPLSSPASDTITIRTEAFFANDPVSLYGFFHDWSGPYHPRNGDNIAMASMRMELGGRRGEWYLAYQRRDELRIRFNHDTADLYHTVKRKLAQEAGKRYKLSVSIDGLRADALTLSRTFDRQIATGGTFRWGLALSMLRGIGMQHGYATGHAVASGRHAYSFTFGADYRYTHNYLYTYPERAGKGYGFSADLALSWHSERYGMGCELLVNDLIGRLWWSGLPYSHIVGSSLNKHYDAQGYASYDPLISGLEKKERYLQRLSPKYRFVLRKELSEKWRIFGSIEHNDYLDLPEISFRYTGERIVSEIAYESRFGTVALKADFGSLRFSLRTDSLTHPSALGAGISARYRF